jgi:beta-glucosidase
MPDIPPTPLLLLLLLATTRHAHYQVGWFADPVAFGDYPASMRQRLGARLPTFTPDEQALLKGCVRAAGS